MGWEYKVLVLPAANYEVDEEITNIHGEKGWELVSVVLDKASYRICYFKRPIPSATAESDTEGDATLGMAVPSAPHGRQEGDV
ncbi:MAG: hypothetical protein H6729_10050 [Deltaproteobacteria bacterium]|nr:hypothetical protein [Deltaproteobacteria bacterium]